MVITRDQTPEQIYKNSPNFTHRNLAKWLIKNNPEFITFYEGKDMTDSDKIENTQRRLKKRLKDLELLGLVKHGKAKQQKGTAEIPVYTYSRPGYVLARIIESFNPNRRDSANNEIYNWLEMIYSIDNHSSSNVIFYAHLFKKCKETGQFDYIVSLFREVINSNIYLKNMNYLLNETLILIFNDPGRTDAFEIILNETLDELDVNTRELFLYHQKLELERRMKLIAGHPKGYEEMCFETRGNPHILAVEGRCVLCRLYFPLGVNLLDYREKIVKDRNEMFGCITTKCPGCKISNALLIPNLLN